MKMFEQARTYKFLQAAYLFLFSSELHRVYRKVYNKLLLAYYVYNVWFLVHEPRRINYYSCLDNKINFYLFWEKIFVIYNL